jgi:hypothetical protein
VDVNSLTNDPTSLATAIACPSGIVTVNWPNIKAALDALGMSSDNCYIAALATVAVETAHTFKPIHEYGTNAYFIRHYTGKLGNVTPDDAIKYSGRGYIQITGEVNYEHYTHVLSMDLITNPDECLDPPCAAAILAAYFHERRVYEAANARDWTRVRKIVNGGTNGLPDFLNCVTRLRGLQAVPADSAKAATA